MKTKTINVCFFLAVMTSGVVHADEVNFHSSVPSKDDVIKALKGHNSSPAEAVEANDSSDGYEGDPVVGKNRMIKMDFGPAKTVVSKSKNRHQASSAAALKKASSASAVNQASIEPASLSMEILFPSGSADLTDAAKKMLQPVGEGLASSELQNLRFEIEGHTDAAGDEVNNLNLSFQRAESVKKYLVEQYKVDSSRVNIEGKGESALLDPRNPTSQVNRRVRIVATR